MLLYRHSSVLERASDISDNAMRFFGKSVVLDGVLLGQTHEGVFS
uniref:Uncharacterized protein n=1 Tax=Trichinella nativa TaxID=6335 RepID=A0A0V1K9R5_9BILA